MTTDEWQEQQMLTCSHSQFTSIDRKRGVLTMWEFLQSYGIWMVLGVLFLFMVRAHGHGGHGGGGCGMGGHGHTKHPKEQDAVVEAREKGDSGTSGGCH